jgi:hypothetical protein
MWKFLKMLMGIALLPFCGAVSIATYKLYQTSLETTATNNAEAWAIPAGFLIWVLLFFLLPRPFRTYVLAHELTHAMWALMMGGRVGKIKVGKSGGHVELSKTNFIITLAPYFFPFYTALAISSYYLTGLALDAEPYRLWWLGAVGLTWSFHITFTIHMLSQQQPDVQEHGRIFSFAVIYTMNVLVIALLLVILGTPRLMDLGHLLGHETLSAYQHAWNICIGLADRFQ